MSEPVTRDSQTTRESLLRDPVADSGRPRVLALLGLFAGAIPLPAIPTALLRRVRGAVVHEVSTRHGLTLTADARAWMSEPSKTVRRGAFVATAAFLAKRALRRLGVLGVLPPIVAWLEVYALGLLFDRYLARHRRSPMLRVDLAEARALRAAIDRSSAGVLSPALVAPPAQSRGAIEDLRDLKTRFSDAVLLGIASGPAQLQRRLHASFDQIMTESAGAFDQKRGLADV
jgi:hypothetical protein